jgi:inner membrane protein YidH
MALQETENSFQRTRMSTDRTLMSVVRTALSLIGFGFTIYQFFERLQHEETTKVLFRPRAPRNLGLTLIFIGVALLLAGIFQHLRFMREMNKQRKQVVGDAYPPFPVSSAMAAAVVLAVVGLLVIFSIMARAGPF